MSARLHRSALRAGLLLATGSIALAASATPASAEPTNGFPGTVKVATPLTGTDPDNVAKPGCALRLDFYGFNARTYDVTFHAIAPTGSKLLANGSATITAPRTPASHVQLSKAFGLDMTGLTPDNLGYHVRVDVTDPSRSGNGSKTKTLAFDCTPMGAAPSFGAARLVLADSFGAAAVGGFATGGGGTADRLPLGALLGLTLGSGLVAAGIWSARRTATT